MKKLLRFMLTIAFLSVMVTASMSVQAQAPRSTFAGPHRPATTTANGVSRPTPVALPPLPNLTANLADENYLKLADRAGWPGAAEAKRTADAEAKRYKEQQEFERYLRDNKVPVYSEESVNKWMDGIVQSLNEAENHGNFRYFYQWEWFPLEGREKSINISGSTVMYSCAQMNTGCNVLTMASSSSGFVTFTTSVQQPQPTRASAKPDAEPDAKPKPEKDYYTLPIPQDVLATVAGIRDCYPEATFDVTSVSARKADPFMRVKYADKAYVIAMWDEPGFTR